MKTQKFLNIHFGALVSSIAEQLADQGIVYGVSMKDAVLHFQMDADAITRLSVRLLLPDGEVRKLRQKLMKRITTAVNDLRVAKVQ